MASLRLVSYGERGKERAGLLVEDNIYDIEGIDPSLPATVRGLLEAGALDRLAAAARDLKPGGRVKGLPAGDARLGAPVPDASKVICLGLNYADHAREQKREPPERPLLFSKAPSVLCGPNDDIVLPEQDDRVDCEAELAVVIGKSAKNVSRERALEVVAGYMAFNDVSARTIQRGDKQWFRGKSFDTFGPCGPALVTRDEVPDPGALAIASYINDSCLQKSETSELIFDIPYVVSYISLTMTLVPGDIISTGTPAGVGVFRDPPIFLKSGDTVTVEIEKIGGLRNKVVSA
jgi:2-keto-4-pentenoate hydratase/2-oxohepta-3-ene-1,7-dioic acid hydratase in catechol pathway